VLVLAPVTFEIQDMLMIPGAMLPMMARAGVDPEGMVWVGSHDTNRFFRISPVDGTSIEYMPLGIGAGGDMVFLDSNRALVPSLEGNLSLVDFSQPREITVVPVPVGGLMAGTLLTGIARDPADRLWLGAADGQLLRVDFMGPEPDGAYVGDTITLGVTLNDLARVVEPPGCERGM
jgi:streptogramin lyase